MLSKIFERFMLDRIQRITLLDDLTPDRSSLEKCFWALVNKGIIHLYMDYISIKFVYSGTYCLVLKLLPSSLLIVLHSDISVVCVRAACT